MSAFVASSCSRLRSREISSPVSRWYVSRSAYGTPSNSLITRDGTGRETLRTRSTGRRAGGQGVEVVVGDDLDTGDQRVHLVCVELAVDRAAHPGVLRRVAGEQDGRSSAISCGEIRPARTGEFRWGAVS